MNSNEEFDLSDSSSLDDSDTEELFHDDDTEMTFLLLPFKELEDLRKLLNRRRGSVMGRVFIQRNRALGHTKLMEDYFAKKTLLLRPEETKEAMVDQYKSNE